MEMAFGRDGPVCDGGPQDLWDYSAAWTLLGAPTWMGDELNEVEQSGRGISGGRRRRQPDQTTIFIISESVCVCLFCARSEMQHTPLQELGGRSHVYDNCSTRLGKSNER